MASTRRRVMHPALDDDTREKQLISLAADLAERQLIDGTASAQTINHFLKLGSSRERREQQRLDQENELLKAKIEQLQSNRRVEELFDEAIRAMRTYSGHSEPELDEEDYDY